MLAPEYCPRSGAEAEAARRKLAALEDAGRALTTPRARRASTASSCSSVARPVHALAVDVQPTFLAGPGFGAAQVPAGVDDLPPGRTQPGGRKRLVDDAMAVEAKGGLKGRVYVDARGLPYKPAEDKQGTGYGGYDESMREMASCCSRTPGWT